MDGDPLEAHRNRSRPYPVSTTFSFIGAYRSPSISTDPPSSRTWFMNTRVASSRPPAMTSKDGPAFPPPAQGCSLYVMPSAERPRSSVRNS